MLQIAASAKCDYMLGILFDEFLGFSDLKILWIGELDVRSVLR